MAGPRSQYREGQHVGERAGGRHRGESRWGDPWAFRPQTWVGKWQEECAAREQSGRQDTLVADSWVVCCGRMNCLWKNNLVSVTLLTFAVAWLVFILHLCFQLILQELTPSTPHIKTMKSCSTCPPCCPTCPTTDSRWVLPPRSRSELSRPMGFVHSELAKHHWGVLFCFFPLQWHE